MRLTKFEHACFTLEKDGRTLVVDPGSFTSNFIIPRDVVAIIVTHEHVDHFDPAMLTAIAAKNPDATLIAHESITTQVSSLPTRTASAGDSLEIGGFTLEFFGGTHATIDPGLSPIANLGVLIDSSLYYPGDSFTEPGAPIKTLLLPIGAPWLKLSEAAAFARSVNPELIIPTHDAVLSDIGKRLADNLVPSLTSIPYERMTAPSNII